MQHVKQEADGNDTLELMPPLWAPCWSRQPQNGLRPQPPVHVLPWSAIYLSKLPSVSRSGTDQFLVARYQQQMLGDHVKALQQSLRDRFQLRSGNGSDCQRKHVGRHDTVSISLVGGIVVAWGRLLQHWREVADGHLMQSSRAACVELLQPVRKPAAQ